MVFTLSGGPGMHRGPRAVVGSGIFAHIEPDAELLMVERVRLELEVGRELELPAERQVLLRATLARRGIL